MEKATFAAGCFWGVEDAFMQVPGVVSTQVGYTGGHTENPTYQEVCHGDTGHAEAVELVFDPEKISYEELLAFFFRMHDPTTLNRQGPDIGEQYRSAIFWHSPDQRESAEEFKRRLNESGRLPRPVVTEITAATPFYPAEEYHQKYFQKQGGGGSCHIVSFNRDE